VSTDVAYNAPSDDQNIETDRAPKLLPLAPTPALTNQDQLTLYYVGGWRELEENDASVVPNIPVECERLLVCLSRAFVIHWEDGVKAIDDEDVQVELSRLVGEFGRRQREYGPMRNTVRTRLRGARYPHDGITRQTT